MSDIQSPIPGIFYRKPAPNKEPFVSEGDYITKGQTIGIVEIMKQFNEIQSTVEGTLVKFNVEDQGTVNPGDILAIVEE
ncbi:biotin carboxyl carrier domain-containing protein [Corynebacterium poyangense]|uniref:Biotin carboxyl carrier protein of acetyl-CoA carboxylase n=1 Tax=Corynebacterium poyangense TaxID=2684405 RepID=A0A7H0SRD2_9CORY|nr:acetyl-CoA carboxylase [Corynebacterium poyangense]MBZ8176541.1 biotin carboxyl carrier domain-containing protein [Corynebacterium poyangense]QNQ91107.1 biotin carboxyl carrier domain-containing protein [Corynebacterium poyangense]